MDQLIDKIAFLLLPNNFKQIFPYCFWYWLIITAIFYWFIKNNG